MTPIAQNQPAPKCALHQTSANSVRKTGNAHYSPPYREISSSAQCALAPQTSEQLVRSLTNQSARGSAVRRFLAARTTQPQNGTLPRQEVIYHTETFRNRR